MLKIHLGCGPHAKEGWQNLDIVPARGVMHTDLRKPLPYKDGSVSVIFTEHFIEHITRTEAVRLLKECYRVLEVGGGIRVTTPNLDVLVADYSAGKLNRWEEVWLPKSDCDMINEGMREWGHQYLYNVGELNRVFREAGFNMTVIQQWGKSNRPEFKNIEIRPFKGEIIMEAYK